MPTRILGYYVNLVITGDTVEPHSNEPYYNEPRYNDPVITNNI